MMPRKHLLLALAILAGCAESTPEKPAAEKPVETPTILIASLTDSAVIEALAARIDQVLPASLPASPAEPRDFGPPQNGLAIRIDAAVKEGPFRVLVRVKNVSDKPINLPANWRRLLSVPQLADQTAWRVDDSLFLGSSGRTYEDKQRWLQPEQTPATELQPGETAGELVGYNIYWRTGTEAPKYFRVELNVNREFTPEGCWSGRISSQSVSAGEEWPVGKYPAPTYTRPLEANLVVGNSVRGNENPFDDDDGGYFNFAAITPAFDVETQLRAMETYDALSRRRALETWLTREGNPLRRTQLAALAARLGSREGTRELLRTLLREDPLEGAWGIRNALRTSGPPEFQRMLTELAHQTLAKRTGQASAGKLEWRVPFGAMDPFVTIMSEQKYSPAVPVLLDATSVYLNSYDALKAIGDRSAVPPLLARLKPKPPWDWNDAGVIMSTIRVLDEDAIVDFLLPKMEHPEAIGWLGQCRQERVRVALRKMIDAKGKVDSAKSSVEVEQERYLQARLAHALNLGADGFDELAAYIGDQSIEGSRRRQAIDYLSSLSDPRTPALLTELFRRDLQIGIRIRALWELRMLRPLAIENELVAALDDDMNLAGVDRYNTPEKLRSDIFETLEALTDKRFGKDAAAWKKWLAQNEVALLDRVRY